MVKIMYYICKFYNYIVPISMYSIKECEVKIAIGKLNNNKNQLAIFDPTNWIWLSTKDEKRVRAYQDKIGKKRSVDKLMNRLILTYIYIYIYIFNKIVFLIICANI